MINVCVTGANGFLGKELCKQLTKNNFNVTGIVRTCKLEDNIFQKIKIVKIASINDANELKNKLNNIDCIIHCAGAAHIMKNKKNNKLLYEKVNELGTKILVNEAINSGVKKIIFLSTIKVNGEQTKNNTFFKYDDVPKPTDDYGISKWNAEKIIKSLVKDKKISYVIIRPPLI